jgi:phosphate starvation-inducible PhoH-like protein
MKVVNAIDGISFVHFDERDVVRHKLVQQIVKAYEAFSNGSTRLSVAREPQDRAEAGREAASPDREAAVPRRHA